MAMLEKLRYIRARLFGDEQATQPVGFPQSAEVAAPPSGEGWWKDTCRGGVSLSSLSGLTETASELPLG